MATTVQTIPLSDDRTETAVEHLQRTVTDLIALGLITKQAHWNLRGKRFISIHELLDQHYSDYQTAIDELAERVPQLGRAVDGRPATVAENNPLAAFPEGFVQDEDVIKHMLNAVSTVMTRARESQEVLGEVDAASEDMMIQLLQKLEMHAWMLRSLQ